METLELNKVFGFFLKQIGLKSPRFRKTEYGYRTYDNSWKLFANSMSITHIKSAKVYNGYDYDDGIEESKWEIVKKENGRIGINFLYTKLF